MPDVLALYWRTGRKNPLTIYAMIGDEPSDDDISIGWFPEAETTARVVHAHNTLLRIGRTVEDQREVIDRLR